MKSATNTKAGSAVLGALILALLISAIAATYLRTAYQDYRYSRELMMGFQALNLAEAGLENAIHAYNNSDWSNWTLEDTGYYSRTFYYSGDRKVRVITDPSTNPRIIFAEGLVDSNATPEISRQILVELAKRGLFDNGLTARRGIIFNGNRISIDSYSSSLGSYDATLNRRDNATVASTSIEEGIVQVENADIWGFVATGGGEPEIGPNGSIRGENTGSGVKVDPTRISYDFYADFPSITPPSTTFALNGYTGNSIGFSGASTTYHLSSLNIGNGNTVTVYGDVKLVVEGNTDIKGQLVVDSNSSLELYVKDDVDVGGTGLVNQTNNPASMQIYAIGSQVGEIKIHGASSLYGVVYAPRSAINLKGGGSVGAVFGALVGNTITMNGNYEFHYDEDLSELGDSGYKISVWRELVASSDKLNFTTLRGSGF